MKHVPVKTDIFLWMVDSLLEFATNKTLLIVKSKPMTYTENVYNIINAVAKRVILEVPESGEFADVYEFIKNIDSKLAIDRYQLKVLKMPTVNVPDPKKRYIEAAVYDIDGEYMASILLLGGYKDTIITELKSKKFPEKLNNAFIELAYMLLHPD